MKPSLSRHSVKRVIAKLVNVTGILRRARSKPGVLILMFHKINNESDLLPLTLNVDLFEELILEINENFEIITVDSIGSIIPGNSDPLNTKGLKIALTFDDGYEDNYINAYPILKTHNIPATIYLSTDHIIGRKVFWYEQIIHALLTSEESVIDLSDLGYGSHLLDSHVRRKNSILYLNSILKILDENERSKIALNILERSGTKNTFIPSKMLDWDSIREMSKNGITFGSHTLSHPILSRETRDRVRKEVTMSKQLIENEIHKPVFSFAYPNGTSEDFNDMVIDEVKNAEYINACTTLKGINRSDTPLYSLRRLNVCNATCAKNDGAFDREYFWATAMNVF
jgi:peptidoglycan/xylan/chitin deacetylase (PgdA/CDA1 family)